MRASEARATHGIADASRTWCNRLIGPAIKTTTDARAVTCQRCQWHPKYHAEHAR